MPAAFALLAAAPWGTTDFLGGVAARHATALAVATISQVAGVVTTAVAAPLLWGTTSVADMMWGLAGGAGGGLAVMVLYRGFQRGRISLASPIAAVGTAVFPAVVSMAAGDAATGLQYAGGIVALAAIWVLAGGGRDDERGPVRASVFYGVLAGAGFALLLIGLGQVEHDFGAPLLATKLGGAVALLVPALAPSHRSAAASPRNAPRHRRWCGGGGRQRRVPDGIRRGVARHRLGDRSHVSRLHGGSRRPLPR